MTSDSWYALKVRPRFELSVAAQLRTRGYPSFVPVYSAKRQWRDRVKSVELPLFAGYVFCQFDMNSRFPILTTPGVQFIAGIGRVPEPIAQDEITSIRTIVSSGLRYEPSPYLAAGQLVQVEHGVLAGLTGLLTDLQSGSRLITSINLLMCSVSVELDPAWVKPIDSKHYHLRRDGTQRRREIRKPEQELTQEVS